MNLILNIFRYIQNTKNTKKTCVIFVITFFFGENFVQSNCGER